MKTCVCQFSICTYPGLRDLDVHFVAPGTLHEFCASAKRDEGELLSKKLVELFDLVRVVHVFTCFVPDVQLLLVEHG